MITAVETNILLDGLIPDTPHGDESERALAEADQLLMRDRGYYATYFPELKLG